MNAIQSFMQNHYTDQRLAALLAHAQDGKLIYNSCCCFIGIATAEHALASKIPPDDLSFFPNPHHYHMARELEGAVEAEREFLRLAANKTEDEERNEQRRTALIPMILEEMDRRAKLRSTPVEPVADLALVY